MNLFANNNVLTSGPEITFSFGIATSTVANNVLLKKIIYILAFESFKNLDKIICGTHHDSKILL